MTYQMNLHPSPFQAISLGLKDVEMRLNAPDRQAIKVGDYIEFTNNESGEKITVLVVGIHPFKDFDELYQAYPKNRLGYLADQTADPKDMELYYSRDKILANGVLAIEIKLCTL